MAENRVYPRIDSDWPLFTTIAAVKKQIGYVKNISLSGALLFFSEEYKLESERHKFTMRLINPQLHPSELTLTGLKEWTVVTENEILLGLMLKELKKAEKTSFIHFLSRSDKLQVEVILLEKD